MKAMLDFINSEGFKVIFFTVLWAAAVLIIYNIISLTIRGIAEFRLTKKAEVLGKIRGYIPYARNTQLCKIGESLFEKKHKKKCREYQKYCAALQVGNLCTDAGILLTGGLTFALYIKQGYTLTAMSKVTLITAGVCAFARVCFGLYNRYILSKALYCIYKSTAATESRAFVPICIIAPVLDITALVLAKKEIKQCTETGEDTSAG